jgi:hypothetical protein
MVEDAATAALLLVFLASAVERGVEVALAPLEGWQSVPLRRALAVTLSLGLGAAIAFGLRLDLIGPLLESQALTATQGRAATALALAGGAAPVHELIRLIEEAKTARKAVSNDETGPPFDKLRTSG